ncbi:hypothetical protein E3N88_01455 [Mikania micrantha]|uniref:Integrase catalytic domain-containing protein n=1 Tax=Mikania micrantha TaxID=192012 RepID=A0A5N6Q144_9ASTR|nr:hypothetical protein E3N88_01455 [Mikania micrantha]
MRTGYAITFDDEACIVTHKGTKKAIYTVPLASNNTFPFDVNQKKDTVVMESSESILWHNRYGHLHEQALQLLKTSNMVDGLPLIGSLPECEGCIYGKQTRNPFPHHAWRSTQPLQLVHADLVGPMPTPSLGGNRYYFLLTDDFTRISWVYFMKRKSESFSLFKKFKAKVEKESGWFIKTLRTDRGGEFLSKEFNEFCETHGIHRDLTAPFTPQQNGVAERKNRTVTEMTRCLLQAKKLPNQFWGEAVATAVYLLSLSPTTAVPGKLPMRCGMGENHLDVVFDEQGGWNDANTNNSKDDLFVRGMVYNDDGGSHVEPSSVVNNGNGSSSDSSESNGASSNSTESSTTSNQNGKGDGSGGRSNSGSSGNEEGSSNSSSEVEETIEGKQIELKSCYTQDQVADVFTKPLAVELFYYLRGNSRFTAKDMTWHHTGRSTDGMMRHPVDGKAWQEFDKKYPNFAKEPRNVRLGLAADGFNPFGNMSQTYSMWPVVLTTYNTPPWPLVDELKTLWIDGVQMRDASTKTVFTMRAALLWTINDYPARSSLSGWSGQGYKACPTCNADTPSCPVTNKIAFIGHRRFLTKNHKWRDSLLFNGKKETRDPPKPLTNILMLKQLQSLPNRVPGKHPSHGGVKRKRATYLAANVSIAIVDLCTLFQKLYARSLDMKDMEKAKKEVIKILCNLELIYPPAFFDIMVHLVLHFPEEAILGGPLYMRWMYPFERYMKKLKAYVRNKARPEGSIAEGYVADEALTFCSMYLEGMQTKFNRPDRNADAGIPKRQLHVFSSQCRPISKKKIISLSEETRKSLEWFVLNNCDEIKDHKSEFESEFPERDVKTEFSSWFRYKSNTSSCISSSDELKALAHGPLNAYLYTACIVNGVRFVVHNRDVRRTTQNSGVVTIGEDKTPFYGQLEEIIEMNYLHATQAKQVFYLQDPSRTTGNWRVVEDVHHRKLWDHPSMSVVNEIDILHDTQSSDYNLVVDDDLRDNESFECNLVVDLGFLPMRTASEESMRDEILIDDDDEKEEDENFYFSDDEDEINDDVDNEDDDDIEDTQYYKGMNPDAWVRVIEELFTTPTYQKRSQANSANRSKQLYGSYHGTQSYAQRRYTEVLETGVAKHVEGWREMHCKGSSGWYNEMAETHWVSACLV